MNALFTPQTPFDLAFTPFWATYVSTDQDVVADAVFQGQRWQNLAFGFQGATRSHQLTLPATPVIGQRVKASDLDGSVSAGALMAFAGTLPIVAYALGAHHKLEAVQGAAITAIKWPGVSITWEWNGVVWQMVEYVQNIDRSGAS